MISCKINNIKVSCTLSGPNIFEVLKKISSTQNSVTKQRSNFFVLRCKFVYIIFYTGHVNITGARDFDQVETAKCELIRIISNSLISINKTVIDNICLSGSLNTSFDLITFADYLRSIDRDFCFNPRRFPGLSVTSIERESGTFLIFASGKFVLVGVKNESEIKQSKIWLTNTISEYQRDLRSLQTRETFSSCG